MGMKYSLIARYYDSKYWIASKQTRSMLVALWTFLVWSIKFDVVSLDKH
jgi:hypothetical protein